jgi:hypothetical protein
VRKTIHYGISVRDALEFFDQGIVSAFSQVHSMRELRRVRGE